MSEYSFTVIKQDDKLTIEEPSGNMMWFIPDGKYLVSGRYGPGYRDIGLIRQDLEGNNILAASSMTWDKK